MIAMKNKDLTPIVMSFLLLLGIVVLAFVRLWRIPSIWIEYPVNVDLLLIGLYILWILAEARISKEDVNTEGKRTFDYATCQIYAFGQACTFLSALWFPSFWLAPNVAHFIGISLFLCGVCYRLWAIRTLGLFYSHRVRTVTQHRIVDSGPYRFTRHPAYAGMIIAHAGLSIYFLNKLTTCIFLFGLLPAILLRIFIEEKMLFGIEGYGDFAGKRKRLFPGVW
jgi:protein-S-isoprenylcysteine O-methyltransferase Ste14